ncbi:ABC transporter permease [Pseudoalteromonas luteoviolacea]|uniref:ABC3 transporter permease protein domain-containing protein n=1 Tax=Pseudoalteromonas luteoviolacea S4054 TaxID=1129367 RepID=A0A0F6A5J6_9GAMM|nr:ABC transporter permease [Pseudoalteromonas luteoviolacea]AOT06563.1 ABC transporter permease [Pseudoalteromonas luteoviolacea]AOT11480.1 ABC transporter permease [Pseudoalteromonas luteoviolacea]AOT16393.1 ABC transporter permease [Pseudoalteromonas luteoviolacea]KKE81116.1 hypothetical protein N479_03680 [Pseudoalteromonas luteoviolacea S4054]KZN62476.1 hypothetical protein N481_03255 [Pseudoalteromonas luteoviolacea S4047-1]
MLKHNLSIALKSLAKVKSYALTIVMTLGITLGVMVAMYNLNYQIIAAPLPYPDQDRLVLVQGQLLAADGEVKRENYLPFLGAIEAYKDQHPGIETLALHNISIDVEQSLPNSPTFNTGAITPEFMQIVDAPLALGRHFNEDEGLNSNQPVAIISYDVWQTHFSGSSDVLYRSVTFKGISFIIVGVTAEHFAEPVLATPTWRTDIWLPYDYRDTQEPLWTFSSNQVHLVGKLSKDADINRTQLALNNWVMARYPAAVADSPTVANTRVKWRFTTYRDRIIGDAGNTSVMMLAGSVVLLLIALSNIGNLVLSRAVEQQRAFAIQAALGAQPHHLFKQVLVELSILFVAALIIATGVVSIILSLLKAGYAGPLARLDELSLNLNTVLFAIALTLILNFTLAWVVSKQLNYNAIIGALQSSGKGSGVQVSKRTRQVLVSLQVFFCISLLVLCVSIFKQSWAQLTAPTHINTDNTSQIALNLGTLLNEMSTQQRAALVLEATERLNQHSDIVRAGVGSYPPISYWLEQFTSYHSQLEPGMDKPIVTHKRVWGTRVYFETFGLTLTQGRHFTDAEARDSAPVVIINEFMADIIKASGQAPIGAKLYARNSSDPITVVGVVNNLNLPNQQPISRIYRPRVNTMYPIIVLETKPNAQLSRQGINDLLAQVHSQIRVYDLQTTEQILSSHLKAQRVASIFTIVLSLVAVVLAGIGIYGVFNYAIALRRYELGIRMSIGATPMAIFKLVLTENMQPFFIAVIASTSVLFIGYLSAASTPMMQMMSVWSWLIPVALIASLVVAITILSAWTIIRQPAQYALKGA